MISLYNIDCNVKMAEYPDKYFDLAIVDPPYGINAPNMQMGQSLSRKQNGYPSESTAVRLNKGRLNQGSGKLKNRLLNKSNIAWDNETPSKKYFDELMRISCNQIIFGGNYFNLPPSRGIVCWDKLQPWKNFSQWEFAWTSFDCPAKMFRYSNTGGANVIEKTHPTEKPIALYKWLLTEFAKPNYKVIDTHGGSFNSAIAAIDFDIAEFVGCEIDLIYYEAALKKINMHMLQFKINFEDTGGVKISGGKSPKTVSPENQCQCHKSGGGV